MIGYKIYNERAICAYMCAHVCIEKIVEKNC